MPPPRPAPAPTAPEAPATKPAPAIDPLALAVDRAPAAVVAELEARELSGRPYHAAMRLLAGARREAWQSAADADPDAAHLLALCRLHGWGGDRDAPGAWAALQSLAERGHAPSVVRVAVATGAETSGEGPTLAARRAALSKAVEGGSKLAAWRLAELDARLDLADGDARKAVERLRAAVEVAGSVAVVETARLTLAGLETDKRPVPEALRQIRDAAAASVAFPEAQRLQAQLLFRGTLGDRNGAAAIALLNRAVDAGDGLAMLLLGEAYFRGWQVIRDARVGEQLVDRAIATTDPRALARSAGWFARGHLVPQDVSRAWSLARAAAEAGEPEGVVALALLLVDPPKPIDPAAPPPPPADRASALAMLRGASELGHAPATFHLAQQTEGPASTDLLLRAARLGDANAVWALGERYLAGAEASRDPKKARECFELAAHNGQPAAMNRLAGAYLTGQLEFKRDPQLARRWAILSADLGHTPAMTLLAGMYYDGNGVEVDVQVASGWMNRAIDAGDTTAMVALGGRYRDGRGVRADAALAYRWFTRAADAGDPSGVAALAGLYRDGLGIEGGANPVEAFRLYQQAADAGSPSGLSGLGTLYRQGLGVERNLSRAVELYRRAASLGDPDGMIALGRLHETGAVDAGVPQDFSAALELYRRAYDAGGLSGAYRLARLYGASSQSPVFDARLAGEWALRGAESGDTDCMLLLGQIFQRGGSGSPREAATAMKWLTRAADAGNTDAMNVLGLMHVTGQGVARNVEEGKRWLTRAAEAGSLPAMMNLGEMALNGNSVQAGVPGDPEQRDPEEALKWFTRAADAGHVPAMVACGRMAMSGIGMVQNYISALYWFEKGAKAGDPTAMAMYGLMLAEGAGMDRPNPTEAAKWIRQSADAEDPDGLYALATLYEAGNTVEKDFARAAEFYRRSAERGHQVSAYNLGMMLSQGRPRVAADPDQAVKWFQQAARAGDPRARKVLTDNGLKW